jgi:Zn-finger nucleic acid-binding protein
MYCPTCKDTHLIMADRQGVEIDYCPKCRGVWLDRGELDKIIERSLAEKNAPPPPTPPPPPQQPYNQPYQQPHQQPHHGQHGQYGQHGHHPYKKKKSFWEDVFDFD